MFFRSMRIWGLLLVAAVIAPGCATVTQGTSQEVEIATDPPGAKCNIEKNGIRIGTVLKTPGIVHVEKGGNSIGVNCSLSGYADRQAFIDLSFEAATVGNVLLGGVVGIVIDAASGAMQKYPKYFYISMKSGETKAGTSLDESVPLDQQARKRPSTAIARKSKDNKDSKAPDPALMRQDAKPQQEAKPKKDALAAFQTSQSKGAQKRAAFDTLPDGPLNAQTIKALFSGLEVSWGYGWHKYLAGCDLEGDHSAGSANYLIEDHGRWNIDSANRLCTDWFSGFGDGRTCYKVSKRGSKIHLRRRSRQVIYEILE